jgi:hypothetical protein
MENETVAKPDRPECLSFLDLPAEIRNGIYALLFEHRHPLIVVRAARAGRPATLHKRHGDPTDGLSLVQIKGEVKGWLC